jgi:hypothetical protein
LPENQACQTVEKQPDSAIHGWAVPNPTLPGVDPAQRVARLCRDRAFCRKDWMAFSQQSAALDILRTGGRAKYLRSLQFERVPMEKLTMLSASSAMLTSSHREPRLRKNSPPDSRLS